MLGYSSEEGYGLLTCRLYMPRSWFAKEHEKRRKDTLLRWPIEQCFEEGKGQIGMDHYEHRSWPAWHRHMAYVFLGLHFLFCLRLRFKKSPALTLPQARRLVAAVLPRHSLNLKGAIEIVKYHTHRNFVAHRSHRKKKLAKLRSQKTKVSL